jgi:hypothetical protein
MSNHSDADLETVHGEPSARIVSNSVSAWVTLRGAHVAPVEFDLGSEKVQPYSLSPWQPADFPELDSLLQVLRGDFFCLPFADQGEKPYHGETAAFPWSVTEQTRESITLRMDTADTNATFHKRISVRDNDSTLYQEIQISGLAGPFNYGTHPILDLSHYPADSVTVTTSPLKWASVSPNVFSDPARGERQILQPAAEFSALSAVPTMDGSTADLSHLPTAPGHEDLVMLCSADDEFAWTAVRFPHFIWFSLRRVADFPSTVLWISNEGRSQAPWLSRHTARLGVEDVCAYFADGLAASRMNHLADKGIPTVREFVAGEDVSLRIIQAVAPIPADGFGTVQSIEVTNATATLIDEDGRRINATCDVNFLRG